MTQHGDTGTDELLVEVAGDGVAIVTLNRPHVRNALSDTLSPALRRTWARIQEDHGVRCVVVTGAGTAFCAGGDVKGMGGASARPGTPRTPEAVIAELTERQRALTGALYRLPQPTIAALPGPAAGAGMALALACDLRIAADTAFITTGFANVGLAGDYGGAFFLTQLVGSAKARELFFTGDRIDANECERLGIVNRVVPAADLMDEALALARRIATGPPIAFAYMKRALDRAIREDLDACLAADAEGTVRTAMTEDHREAVRAFVEKRKPTFRGK